MLEQDSDKSASNSLKSKFLILKTRIGISDRFDRLVVKCCIDYYTIKLQNSLISKPRCKQHHKKSFFATSQTAHVVDSGCEEYFVVFLEIAIFVKLFVICIMIKGIHYSQSLEQI